MGDYRNNINNINLYCPQMQNLAPGFTGWLKHIIVTQTQSITSQNHRS